MAATIAVPRAADGHPLATVDGSGVRSWSVLAPAAPPLVLAVGALAGGALVRIEPDGRDHVVYLMEGEAAVDGARLRPRGAAIAEGGATLVLEAVTDATVLHLVHRAPPPAIRCGDAVHVVGPAGVAATTSRADGIELTYYADSTCAGCSATFFRVKANGPYAGGSHAHSADEIIFVTRGSIRVGRGLVTAGTGVAIPRNERYRFTAEAAFEFVNYRAAPSSITRRPADGAERETAEALGCHPVTGSGTG